ncbi:MAG: glycosyltransferase family 4 protein [candidate division Zixibacteria bacterium]
MRILIANKYLYPRGGDCLYTLRLMDLLRDAGHEVIPFSMSHPENVKTGFEKYFVPYIDFREELGKFGFNSAVKVTSRSIINKQAAALMERIIIDHKPDIVHLNNIHHQLTPSILEPAVKQNIPIVWTLHDYILTCPNHNHLRSGSICTKCAGGNNAHALIHRCKKRSFGASLLAALESTYYSPEKLSNMVNKFICPSRFMADFLIDNGLPPGRVTNIPNFLPSIKTEDRGHDYFLYFGRLSGEKGIDILLEAMSLLKKGKLIIAGDGPDGEKLMLKAKTLGLSNVEFIGRKTPESIIELLSECLAVIMPSICWENLPYSLMESMAAGKLVIGSRIGGIPEMIEHGKNGLLFEPGNAVQLTDCMNTLLADTELARRMGESGREKARNLYSPEKHLEDLVKLYSNAIARYAFSINDELSNIKTGESDKNNSLSMVEADDDLFTVDRQETLRG